MEDEEEVYSEENEENIGAMQEIVCSDLEDLSDQDDVENEAITPLRDDADLCVSLHEGSVFCMGASSAGALACSGGEDDRGLVWNLDNGSILFQCHGHKDSVTCIGFSHDGKYVASADLNGLVQVWDPSTGELVWSFETGADVEWLKWHPQSHVLLVGGNDGNMWMWRIPSGDTKTFLGDDSSNTCAGLTSDGKRICCGYGSGSVKVLDLRSGATLVHLIGTATAASSAEATVRFTDQGHAKSVTCLEAHHEGTLLLTGSEDETARLINSTNGKVVCAFPAGFAPPRSGSDNGDEGRQCSVEAVCFSPIFPVALTGSLSGVLGVWDLPTQKLRQKCTQESQYQSEPAGFVRLCCSHECPMVYSGGLDGVVRGWDLRNGQLVREWHGHSGAILDMMLLQNETGILSASDDGTVRRFSLDKT